VGNQGGELGSSLNCERGCRGGVSLWGEVILLRQGGGWEREGVWGGKRGGGLQEGFKGVKGSLGGERRAGLRGTANTENGRGFAVFEGRAKGKRKKAKGAKENLGSRCWAKLWGTPEHVIKQRRLEKRRK